MNSVEKEAQAEGRQARFSRREEKVSVSIKHRAVRREPAQGMGCTEVQGQPAGATELFAER